ncbi:CHAT domain-containing protein [Calothrix sp. FACHB-1219]|uniref:CHAT domain-containing protein n=1 Tax=unclassified Calothrix TaxID=2619626 RepID=UPI001688E0B4|nr:MULTISPECIES: CHAT domain-containing tetratricopeptide repeat protein [unclassified Calothrix]MBD2201285.1 CHAT domain-containing protein [Calothrix sp. FACHB-168]MBD2215719.1 CHAT domain-containing protein [Calothrix sp. FACHB-1219]
MGYRNLSLIAFITLILTTFSPTANFLAFLQMSQVLAQPANAQKAEADRLYQQGDRQIQTSQYTAALQSFQQALAIYRQLKDRPGEALSLNYIAIVQRTLGDYIQALEFYKQALDIFRELGDRLNEGTALNNIGKVYEGLGQYPQALDFYQQALAIRKQVGDRSGEAFTLADLGSIYTSLGQYPQVLGYLQQSLDIFRKIGDRKQEALILNSIGLYYRTIDQYTQAVEYYQQALAIFKQLGNRRGEATCLNNIGDFRRNQGEYSQAQELFQQVLTIFREVNDRGGQGVALSNIGRVYAYQKQYPQALESFAQALAIFQEVGDKPAQARTFRYIGSAFYQSGKLPEAEQALRTGIDILESLRPKLSDANKVSLFETQLATYQLLQQVLIAQNKPETALEISERGRARAFLELLTSRLSANNNVTKAPQLPSILEMQQIAKRQNSHLVQYSIIKEEFLIAGKPQIKESELYIWVIKPTGEVSFRKTDLKPLWQKDKTTLNDYIITSRNSIGTRGTAFRGVNVVYNPNAPAAKNNLKHLYQLLINPIADLLPQNPNERVTFIPQGGLFLVPFPALQDEQGKYLIEKHTILTSPSIQVLDLTHKQLQRIGKQPIQGNNTLIVGNPTMPFISPKIGDKPQQLTPLPGAEQEANAIAKLLKTQPLIGSKATKAAVLGRLTQARFAHLATHGIFDDIQGLNSAIALAPNSPGSKGNQKGDGLLTAAEILDLKLNAELVVLSACDTGRGRISGDGVIGLSRSLISAGVPSVLVSLWSVPDAPTASLMTEFYQNLQKSPDKAQALRQAMLTTMKNNPNPVDWATFTLIGEAE